MEAVKNLHASIPDALLAEAQKAAMEQRLQNRRRQNLYAYGEGQARKLGIKEEDVERIIHEFREEYRAGKYHDSERR